MIGINIQKLQFAMEFASHGNLSSYIEEQYDIPDIPEDTRQDDFPHYISGTALNRMLTFKIAYQIVAAVEYLHDKGIIHADLKTNNILLFSPEVEECVNVKLADYGLSQSATKGGAVRSHANSHAFVAPEIVNRRAFDQEGTSKFWYETHFS